MKPLCLLSLNGLSLKGFPPPLPPPPTPLPPPLNHQRSFSSALLLRLRNSPLCLFADHLPSDFVQKQNKQNKIEAASLPRPIFSCSYFPFTVQQQRLMSSCFQPKTLKAVAKVTAPRMCACVCVYLCVCVAVSLEVTN